jgi:hypothetical protein
MPLELVVMAEEPPNDAFGNRFLVLAITDSGY